MANVQYKVQPLVGVFPVTPAIAPARPNTLLSWTALRNAMKAQDGVLSTPRRIVARLGRSGHNAWAVPSGENPTTSGQVYPDAHTWRTLGTFWARVSPGSYLESAITYCPSGLTEGDLDEDGNWQAAGAFGQARVRVTWSNGSNDNGPNDHSTTLEGSNKGTWGGDQNSADGSNWSALRTRLIQEIWPDDLETDPTVSKNYSEMTDVKILLQVRGSPRIASWIVYEMPKVHTTLHSNSGLVSAAAIANIVAKQTQRPQTRSPHGAIYNEFRFGTHRLLQVAEQQAEKLGTRPISWCSWWPGDVDGDWAANPRVITSTSFVDVFDDAITSYSQDNPGLTICGAESGRYRENARSCIMRGLARVVPFRAIVDAEWTGDQVGGKGTVRIQTGTYEFEDVEFSSSGSRQQKEISGFCEAMVTPDQTLIANVQFFGKTTDPTASTLEVWGVSADFDETALAS